MTIEEPANQKGRIWAFVPAILLVGLLGMQLAFLAGTFNDPSFAVEANYYDKAVTWDAKMAQDRENARLGFRVDVDALPPSSGGEPNIVVRVTDAEGKAVSGASVEVEGFHNARANDVLHGKMVEVQGGVYVGELPVRRPGLWELRLRVTRQSDLFTHVARLDLPMAGSGS